MRQYISGQKILHKMKEVVCGALSHKMDELILRKHQVDGTQLLHTCTGSLLQCI